MDQTTVFWEVVLRQARLQGVSEERFSKLRSAQILRSLASKSEFIRAAIEVAKNINALRSFVAMHRREYAQAGKLDDSRRDKIEEQVGLSVRSCTANISKLESTIERAEDLSPQGVAHRHGVALILSERLQSVSAAFDVCRSQRYQQLLVERHRQQKRQQEIQKAKHSTAMQAKLPAYSQPNGNAWVERSSGNAGKVGQDPEYQEQMQAENQALQEELRSLGQQVAQTEASMRELATLNQMFSTQVLHQSEQTRQLYQQALRASEFVGQGNVQLQKAIRLNSSTRKILFVFFLVASLLLLIFDWWSS